MNPTFTTASLLGVLPDLILLLGAFLVLAVDIPLRRDLNKRAVQLVADLAMLGALAAVIYGWRSEPTVIGGVLISDPLALAAKAGLIFVGLSTLSLVRHQGVKSGLWIGEFFALLLFALAGMTLFAMSKHLILTFAALETFSLAMYVMAGFRKQDPGSREAALKYFILGAFAAAFYLLGMAFTFGAAGSADYAKIGEALRSLPPESPRALLLMMGLLLVSVALAFKVGLAPFHLWVPDVYEGAPTPVTAFLSAGAKIAGFAALVRLALYVPFSGAAISAVLGTLAILTILLGNVGALKQMGLKRLLAYSSIAHSGYALVGLVGGSPEGPSAVMRYVLVYAVMNLLTFGLIISMEEDGRELTLEDVQGLGFTKPYFGAAMAIAMFAMAGLPPTAGFIAKFGVFKAALQAGETKFAVLAILGSVISAAVYLRVLVALYMKPQGSRPATPVFGFNLGFVLAVSALMLLIWGVLPGSLAQIVGGL